MTRAERKAKKALHKARAVTAAYAGMEQRAVRVIDGLTAEVEHLREIQERFRHVWFGAMLGRALGDETKMSDALLAAYPEMFKGMEEAPWMAFSSS